MLRENDAAGPGEDDNVDRAWRQKAGQAWAMYTKPVEGVKHSVLAAGVAGVSSMEPEMCFEPALDTGAASSLYEEGQCPAAERPAG